MNQPFASVGVRRDCSSVNTLAPCGGSLFSITGKSPWEADSCAHDIVVRVRMRLQVNSDISNKLAMWLSRDNVVNTFPIRGSGTVECTCHSLRLIWSKIKPIKSSFLLDNHMKTIILVFHDMGEGIGTLAC